MVGPSVYIAYEIASVFVIVKLQSSMAAKRPRKLMSLDEINCYHDHS